MAFMSLYMDVHISICAHMCEMNIKDICACLHANWYVYITLFAYVHVCTYMYICVDVFICLCM